MLAIGAHPEEIVGAGNLADPDDYGRILSLADAGEILGVHPQTIRRYVRDGMIPAHHLPGGKRYYIFKDELLEFLRSHPVSDPSNEETTEEHTAEEEDQEPRS